MRGWIAYQPVLKGLLDLYKVTSALDWTASFLFNDSSLTRQAYIKHHCSVYACFGTLYLKWTDTLQFIIKYLLAFNTEAKTTFKNFWHQRSNGKKKSQSTLIHFNVIKVDWCPCWATCILLCLGQHLILTFKQALILTRVSHLQGWWAPSLCQLCSLPGLLQDRYRLNLFSP